MLCSLSSSALLFFLAVSPNEMVMIPICSKQQGPKTPIYHGTFRLIHFQHLIINKIGSLMCLTEQYRTTNSNISYFNEFMDLNLIGLTEREICTEQWHVGVWGEKQCQMKIEMNISFVRWLFVINTDRRKTIFDWSMMSICLFVWHDDDEWTQLDLLLIW